MKKTGLLPVFIDTDNTLLVCLRDIKDACSICNTTLEGTAIETAIKYAKTQLGYKHNSEYNIKRANVSDMDSLFYVVVDEMFTPNKEAQWLTTDAASKIIMGYMHNDFDNIIEKIKGYVSKNKVVIDTDFMGAIETIGDTVEE